MTCTVKRLLDYWYGLETVKGTRYHQPHDRLLSNTRLTGKKEFIMFREDFHPCFREEVDIFILLWHRLKAQNYRARVTQAFPNLCSSSPIPAAGQPLKCSGETIRKTISNSECLMWALTKKSMMTETLQFPRLKTPNNRKSRKFSEHLKAAFFWGYLNSLVINKVCTDYQL